MVVEHKYLTRFSNLQQMDPFSSVTYAVIDIDLMMVLI